ncbi:MAG: hypothetical protein GX483_00335 [Actinomycetaceae bacterium]|nr:hypothetical protein [Actinomycetaceae bacterium]
MIALIIDVTLPLWRKFLLGFIAVVLAAATAFLALSADSRLDAAVDHSATQTVAKADFVAYNDTINGVEFLEQIAALDTVDQAYYPMSVWGHVMTPDESLQLVLRNAPPAQLRTEDFYAGGYPEADNELALTYTLAKQLDVHIGDQVTVVFPDIGTEGVARILNVSGIYAYSPFSSEFDSSFNALLGMELMPYWESSSGRFPITHEGVQIIGKDSADATDLKLSLLTIAGTVLESYDDRIEATQVAHGLKADEILAPVPSMVILAGIGLVLIIFLSARQILHNSRRDGVLLRALGLSQRRLFWNTVAQFYSIIFLATVLGIMLGQAVNQAQRSRRMDGPGGDFLPSQSVTHISDIVLTIAIISIVTLIGIVPVALEAVQLSRSDLASSDKPRVSPRPIQVISFLAVVAGFASMILLTMSVGRTGIHIDVLVTTPTTYVALVLIALLVGVVLFLHSAITHVIRRGLRSYTGPRPHFLQPAFTIEAAKTKPGFGLARLSLIATALLTTLLSAVATNSAHITQTAREITPYDIAIQAPDSLSLSFTEHDIEVIARYPDVVSVTEAYSTTVHPVIDGRVSSRSLFVYALDAGHKPDMFTDLGSVLSSLEPGNIFIPADVLAYLGLSDGDEFTLSGDKGRQITLTVVESPSPWVVTTLDDLHMIAAIDGPSEIWLDLVDDLASHPGQAFIDMRSYLIDEGLAGNYRVQSALSTASLEAMRPQQWHLKAVMFLFVTGLGLTIYADTRTTARNSTCQDRNTRLLISMGLTRRHLMFDGMVEALIRTGWAALLGILLGAGSFVTLHLLRVTDVQPSAAVIPVTLLIQVLLACILAAFLLTGLQYLLIRRRGIPNHA